MRIVAPTIALVLLAGCSASDGDDTASSTPEPVATDSSEPIETAAPVETAATETTEAAASQPVDGELRIAPADPEFEGVTPGTLEVALDDREYAVVTVTSRVGDVVLLDLDPVDDANYIVFDLVDSVPDAATVLGEPGVVAATSLCFSRLYPATSVPAGYGTSDVSQPASLETGHDGWITGLAQPTAGGRYYHLYTNTSWRRTDDGLGADTERHLIIGSTDGAGVININYRYLSQSPSFRDNPGEDPYNAFYSTYGDEIDAFVDEVTPEFEASRENYAEGTLTCTADDFTEG